MPEYLLPRKERPATRTKSWDIISNGEKGSEAHEVLDSR